MKLLGLMPRLCVKLLGLMPRLCFVPIEKMSPKLNGSQRFNPNLSPRLLPIFIFKFKPHVPFIYVSPPNLTCFSFTFQTQQGKQSDGETKVWFSSEDEGNDGCTETNLQAVVVWDLGGWNVVSYEHLVQNTGFIYIQTDTSSIPERNPISVRAQERSIEEKLDWQSSSRIRLTSWNMDSHSPSGCRVMSVSIEAH